MQFNLVFLELLIWKILSHKYIYKITCWIRNLNFWCILHIFFKLMLYFFLLFMCFLWQTTQCLLLDLSTKSHQISVQLESCVKCTKHTEEIEKLLRSLCNLQQQLMCSSLLKSQSQWIINWHNDSFSVFNFEGFQLNLSFMPLIMIYSQSLSVSVDQTTL